MLSKRKLVNLALIFHHEQSLSRSEKNEFLDDYCCEMDIYLLVYPDYKSNVNWKLPFGYKNASKKIVYKGKGR